jgi:hypothetical protein
LLATESFFWTIFMYLIAWTATLFPILSKELDKSLKSDSVASSFATAQRGKTQQTLQPDLLQLHGSYIEGAEDLFSMASNMIVAGILRVSIESLA